MADDGNRGNARQRKRALKVFRLLTGVTKGDLERELSPIQPELILVSLDDKSKTGGSYSKILFPHHVDAQSVFDRWNAKVIPCLSGNQPLLIKWWANATTPTETTRAEDPKAAKRGVEDQPLEEQQQQQPPWRETRSTPRAKKEPSFPSLKTKRETPRFSSGSNQRRPQSHPPRTRPLDLTANVLHFFRTAAQKNQWHLFRQWERELECVLRLNDGGQLELTLASAATTLKKDDPADQDQLCVRAKEIEQLLTNWVTRDLVGRPEPWKLSGQRFSLQQGAEVQGILSEDKVLQCLIQVRRLETFTNSPAYNPRVMEPEGAKYIRMKFPSPTSRQDVESSVTQWPDAQIVTFDTEELDISGGAVVHQKVYGKLVITLHYGVSTGNGYLGFSSSTEADQCRALLQEFIPPPTTWQSVTNRAGSKGKEREPSWLKGAKQFPHIVVFKNLPRAMAEPDLINLYPDLQHHHIFIEREQTPHPPPVMSEEQMEQLCMLFPPGHGIARRTTFSDKRNLTHGFEIKFRSLSSVQRVYDYLMDNHQEHLVQRGYTVETQYTAIICTPPGSAESFDAAQGAVFQEFLNQHGIRKKDQNKYSVKDRRAGPLRRLISGIVEFFPSSVYTHPLGKHVLFSHWYRNRVLPERPQLADSVQLDRQKRQIHLYGSKQKQEDCRKELDQVINTTARDLLIDVPYSRLVSLDHPFFSNFQWKQIPGLLDCTVLKQLVFCTGSTAALEQLVTVFANVLKPHHQRQRAKETPPLPPQPQEHPQHPETEETQDDQECLLCFCPLERPHWLLGCQDVFCIECLETMMATRKMDRHAVVRCPNTKCGKPISLYDLSVILPPDDLQQLYIGACQQFIEEQVRKGTLLPCPEPGCGVVLTVPDGHQEGVVVSCDECEKSFCASCCRKHDRPVEAHPGQPCSATLSLDDLDKSTARHRLRIAETIFTLKCPRCSLVFLDWDGCAAVRCSQCNCSFCGLCLKDCGEDAHSHVKACDKNPEKPSFFVSQSALTKAHQTLFRKAYLDYLNQEVETVILRRAVHEACQADLRGLGLEIPLSAING